MPVPVWPTQLHLVFDGFAGTQPGWRPEATDRLWSWRRDTPSGSCAGTPVTTMPACALSRRRSVAWDVMAEPAAVPADLAFPQDTHILSTGPAFSWKSGIERPQIRVWFPLSVDRSLAQQQGAPAASQNAVPSVWRSCLNSAREIGQESLRRGRRPTCPPHPRWSGRGPPRSPTDHAWVSTWDTLMLAGNQRPSRCRPLPTRSGPLARAR